MFCTAAEKIQRVYDKYNQLVLYEKAEAYHEVQQKLDSAEEKARIASFVAVAPIDDPQFLCLVCLDEPHSWTTAGGSLSAPVCAEVLEQTLVYRGVPRTTEASAASTAETAADLPADGDSFDGA